jgi:ubiquitin C-terminal hydrolase
VYAKANGEDEKEIIIMTRPSTWAKEVVKTKDVSNVCDNCGDIFVTKEKLPDDAWRDCPQCIEKEKNKENKENEKSTRKAKRTVAIKKVSRRRR